MIGTCFRICGIFVDQEQDLIRKLEADVLVLRICEANGIGYT